MSTVHSFAKAKITVVTSDNLTCLLRIHLRCGWSSLIFRGITWNRAHYWGYWFTKYISSKTMWSYLHEV